MPQKKSVFTLGMEASRDAQPMTTRCGFQGCRWRHRGTAAAGRAAARLHRETQHPGLPPPRVRPRNLPPRETPAPPPLNGSWPASRRITEPRARAAAAAYERGWTLAQIAARTYAAWGFRSPDSCKNSLPDALRALGVPTRGRGVRVPRTLDPADLDQLVRDAG